ncbi:661_t:CDS:1, partial [Acaulospora colombiana]
MSSTRRDEPNMPVTPSRRRVYNTSVTNDSPRRMRAIMNGLTGSSSDDEMGDYQTADTSLRSPVRLDNRAMSSAAGKKTAVLESRSSTSAVHDNRRAAIDNATIDEYNGWSDDQMRQTYVYRVNQLDVKDRELKAKDKELKAKNEELEAKEEQIEALKEQLRLLREERDYFSSRRSQHPSPSKTAMQ